MTPNPPTGRCAKCGDHILAVRVIEGYLVPVDATQHPIDQPINGAYEHHPHGWHTVSADTGFKLRGHPVHAAHHCKEGNHA